MFVVCSFFFEKIVRLVKQLLFFFKSFGKFVRSVNKRTKSYRILRTILIRLFFVRLKKITFLISLYYPSRLSIVRFFQKDTIIHNKISFVKNNFVRSKKTMPISFYKRETSLIKVRAECCNIIKGIKSTDVKSLHSYKTL